MTESFSLAAAHGLTRFEVRLMQKRFNTITSGGSERWKPTLTTAGPASVAYTLSALMWIPVGVTLSLLGGVLLVPSSRTWALLAGIVVTYSILLIVLAVVFWRLGQSRKARRRFRRFEADSGSIT
jgi:hypothetical protein